MHGPAIVIDLLFRVYFGLIIVWVLSSWFPQWRYQPWFKTVEGLVRPYLDLFRGLPLRIGMMDLTPMVAIFVLFLFQNLLLAVLFRGLR